MAFTHYVPDSFTAAGCSLCGLKVDGRVLGDTIKS